MYTGEQIKAIRKRKGFTQRQIAGYIGIDPSNYGRMENGKVKITNSNMELIIEALHRNEILPEHYRYPEMEKVRDERLKYVRKHSLLVKDGEFPRDVYDKKLEEYKQKQKEAQILDYENGEKEKIALIKERAK